MGTLAVTIVLAGCGGADTAGRTSTAPQPAAQEATTAVDTPTAVSHGAFVRRLDRICREGNRQIDKLNAQFDQGGNTAADALVSATGAFDRAIDAVSRLEVPAKDRPAFTRYLSALRRTRSAMHRMATAVRTRQVDEQQALSDALDVVKRRRLAAALDLGADDCGK